MSKCPQLFSEKIIFFIKIAETIIEVRSLFPNCLSLCSTYLLDKEDCEISPDFVIDIVPRNIKYENDESQITLNKNPERGYLYYDPGYMEIFAVHRKLCESMPKYGSFLMHGAVVAYDNCGYMFTAPSGVGKSTRINLWKEEFPDSIIVNGDKPFIRVSNGDIYVYGSPWCGKEHLNTNIGVPLRAIFLLERISDGEESSVEELQFSEAYSELIRQIYKPIDPEALFMTLSLLSKLSGKVKIFRFRSSPTRASIRLAYETVNIHE